MGIKTPEKTLMSRLSQIGLATTRKQKLVKTSISNGIANFGKQICTHSVDTLQTWAHAVGACSHSPDSQSVCVCVCCLCFYVPSQVYVIS